MPLTFIACIVLLGLMCLLGVACSRRPSEGGATQTPVTAQSLRSMSRQEVLGMLKTLETRRAPEPKMGAMCYAVAAPPQRAEYVCPKCGEKTLYTKDDAVFIAWEIEACRREFEILKDQSHLSVALDESEYCAHCSPVATKHQLALVVTYADGSSHTTSPVSRYDLRILRDFLSGRTSFDTLNEGSAPLKGELPRLRELLGIGPAEGDPRK